jgi:hypothetical protein
VLENTEGSAMCEGESKHFNQLIFMKLYKIDGSKEMFSSGPTADIDSRDYRNPTAIKYNQHFFVWARPLPFTKVL